MIKVWSDGEEAGFLDRMREKFRERGTTFAYRPDAPPERAVSVTMPVRLESWNTAIGLAPLFEMNLPEGALRERLRLAFAKAAGSFEDFDLLAILGRSQLGLVRYSAAEDGLDEAVPFQSVDEILANRSGGTLFRYLLEKFASVSGISGVQPKVLIQDREAFAAANTKHRFSESYRGATHIVKFWEADEFPQLAANEYFCLRAAQRCGLDTPAFQLAQDGLALVINRFDLRADGSYRGFEDFCVLNARRTDEKYRGSYESSIMKRFQQFANSPHVFEDLTSLFTLIALNCALRNGDAHLKNFSILYDDVRGAARLAPVYDLVTTTAYLPQDRMALTLDGSTQWPSAKKLREFGVARMTGSPAQIRQILEKIADAMSETASEIRSYIQETLTFAEIGGRMLEEWEAGRKQSLEL
jgi:serine/threonine-protein kinase HipA